MRGLESFLLVQLHYDGIRPLSVTPRQQSAKAWLRRFAPSRCGSPCNSLRTRQWTLRYSSCFQRGAPSRLHAVRHGKAVAPSRTLRRSVRPLCPARVARCGSRPCSLRSRNWALFAPSRPAPSLGPCFCSPGVSPRLHCAVSRPWALRCSFSARGHSLVVYSGGHHRESHSLPQPCPHGAGAQGQALAAARPVSGCASRQRPRFAPSPHATTAGSVPKQTPPYPLRKHSSSGGVAG